MKAAIESGEGEAGKAKWRCPYCHEMCGPDVSAKCSHCGKVMVLPSGMATRTAREKKNIRERIREKAERERARLFVPDIRVGRTSLLMVIGLALIVVMGVTRMRQAESGAQATRVNTRHRDRGQRNLNDLRVALERFRKDCGRYPTEQEGLQALVRDLGAAGWCGHYVNQVTGDPWRKPYVYRVIGENEIKVFSLGPDGKEGTADDLTAEPADPQRVMEWDGQRMKAARRRVREVSIGGGTPEIPE